MTTTHSENLDNALLRPRRADMRIRLQLATNHPAENLFVQFFFDRNSTGWWSWGKGSRHTGSKAESARSYFIQVRTASELRGQKGGKGFYRTCSWRYSKSSWDKGVLMMRKAQPERAVIEVEHWRTTRHKLKWALRSKLTGECWPSRWDGLLLQCFEPIFYPSSFLPP